MQHDKMQKRSNGWLITCFAHTSQYPNKIMKDTEPFLLADICLHTARGKALISGPPSADDSCPLSRSPPLILNEGSFLVFLCCWWGVAGSGKNEDFLERAFKCRAEESLPLSLSLPRSLSRRLSLILNGVMLPARTCCFQRPQRATLLHLPFPPLPQQPFLLLSLPFLFHLLSLTSPSCHFTLQMHSFSVLCCMINTWARA